MSGDRIEPNGWAADVVTAVPLGSAGVRVVAVLAEHATRDGDDVVAPGSRDTARRCGCAPVTVRAAVNRLARAGWLTRLTPGGHGPGDRALYRLTIPDHDREAVPS